jgi:hypothetical protein
VQKLTAAQATRQINRLSGLPRFAELGKPGIGEMVRVLCDRASGEDHAERTVTAWIDNNKWLPTCAELIEALDLTPAKTAALKPNWECDHCQGSAFERTWLLVTYVRHPSGHQKDCEEKEITAEVAAQLITEVDGHYQKVASAVKYCRCSFGQEIKRQRIARMHEDEQKSHKGSRRA